MLPQLRSSMVFVLTLVAVLGTACAATSFPTAVSSAASQTVLIFLSREDGSVAPVKRQIFATTDVQDRLQHTLQALPAGATDQEQAAGRCRGLGLAQPRM